MTASRRYAAAAVLAVVALGFAWSYTTGVLQPSPYGFFSSSTGPDGVLTTTYTPGGLQITGGGEAVAGYASDVRVLLVPAAVLLAWSAAHPERAARPARAALVLLVALVLLAVGRGAVAPLVCLAAASVLVAPVARRTVRV